MPRALSIVASLGVAALLPALPFACVSSGTTTPSPDGGTGIDLDASNDHVVVDAGVSDATPGDSSPSDTGLSDAVASGDTSTRDGAVGVWVPGPKLPVPRIHAVAAAPGNGFVYVADGYIDGFACTAGTSDGRVFYAKQNADGSLGAWAETQVGPSGFARSIPGHVDANGFIYVAGGAINAPSWDGNVFFAKPAADGTITSWTTATNPVPSTVGSAPVMTVVNGALYVGGGFTLAGVLTSVFTAPLDSTTGQPGTWTELASLPEAPSNPQLVVSAAGYAYYFQGSDTNVYVAPLSALSEGDAGPDAASPWTLSAMALPVTPDNPYATIVGTTLYVIPGGSSAVYASALGADGSLGSWSLYSRAPATISAGYQGILASGFLYVLGDDDCNAATDDAGMADDAGDPAATYYVPFP
jgi:hypothetical protein